jgi:hypothetical protein
LALIRTPVLGPRFPPVPTGMPEEMALYLYCFDLLQWQIAPTRDNPVDNKLNLP